MTYKFMLKIYTWLEPLSDFEFIKFVLYFSDIFLVVSVLYMLIIFSLISEKNIDWNSW